MDTEFNKNNLKNIPRYGFIYNASGRPIFYYLDNSMTIVSL